MWKSRAMLIPIFTFLYIYFASGSEILPPELLEVHILDGEVTVKWRGPMDIPSNTLYNVQMAKYSSGKWVNVPSCMRISNKFCSLSDLIIDYRTPYIARVQVVNGSQTSLWTKSKKFLLNEGELLPPSFKLQTTSSILSVHIDEKPILKKLFPYGVKYTIHLEEIGQENKNTTVYSKENRTHISALRWGGKYCVSIKVEDIAGSTFSNFSHKKCVTLPEQELFIIAKTSLFILGVLAPFTIMTSILLCYLRHPAKTPSSLKSLVSDWLPLSTAEVTLEKVTDKGWFLSSYNTELTTPAKRLDTHITIVEDSEDENRRSSLDSGVSVETDSAAGKGEGQQRQEDSGCGSMGGSESFSDNQTDYPIQDGTIETGVRKKEDSGVGVSLQMESSSSNLGSHDDEALAGNVTVRSYHSQLPFAFHPNAREGELKQALICSDEVVSEYRAGPQSCICSGAGQCSWCHKNCYGPDSGRHYRAVQNCGELGGNSVSADAYSDSLEFSEDVKELSLDNVLVTNFDTTLLQMNDTFPLLTSLPLKKCGQDFNMNNVSFSLCDVQLTID